jgi:4-hydroxybenzoyl-CoA thioesterase
MPLVDTRARFLKPSRFGDVVDISSTILSFGRSSFEVRHQLINGGHLAVEGHEKRVWTVRDPTSNHLRSEPIPREIIDAFAQ